MPNITVTVPEEVYRQARVKAAEEGSSVSALVTRFLTDLTSKDDEFQRLLNLQREVTAEIRGFRAGDRLSRDEIHDRAIR